MPDAKTATDAAPILLERMRRQHLLEPLEDSDDEDAYAALFRLLQPVAPVHNTRPGDPPRLVHRTRFPDHELTARWRSEHRIVKGRFLGGRVGYVWQEDLPLYATACRKPLKTLKPIHEDILAAIRTSGGISKTQLKEELPYPAGKISAALQDLQAAFLVYEEQPDTDWDTGWFDFATEWFEVVTDPETTSRAMADAILNFIRAMVQADPGQIRSWSGFPRAAIREALGRLETEGRIARVETALGDGYMTAEDAGRYASRQFPDEPMPCRVFMLDKSDLLVRAHLEELEKRFAGREILQYLLIDGQFRGAVAGHWRIGPHAVEDIVLDLDEREAAERKEEILDAVRWGYPPETHPILRYNGCEL